ncbi:MAG TPA: serine hydrolase domain-containing protein [Hyphomonadaceae bacterium]|jgi:CubicO group peptidase (beta-lactamase class C family)|nr:serine hydrolase domain-containing protein [Hyphomonadaceae bacterium]
MNAPSRRDVSVAAIALAMLGAARNAQAQTPPAEAPLSDDQIRAILAERVGSEAPGMVIGLVSRQGRRIVSHGAFGISDKRPVAADTIFGIASVSKAFTGFLLPDAIRRKEVKLDDPVARYLPTGVKLPERNGRKITLMDLATHTSGLPHELPPELQAAARAGPAREARAFTYKYLADWKLPTDIGSTWSYSNLEYGVIAFALEQRTGLAYDQLLRTRILDPLKLDDTAITLSPSQWERRAHPHTSEVTASPEFNKPWSISTLQSTANDLLTFLAAATGITPSPLKPSFDAMLSIRRPAPMLGQGAEQSIGWYVHPFNGRPIIGHSGSGGGFGGTALFDPAAQIGVVLLANAENIWEDVAAHSLRPSLPLNKKDTGIVLTDAVLDSYVGRYTDGAGAAWVVVREPTGLILRHPQGYRVPLIPQTETRFSVPSFPNLSVVFDRGPDARPSSLTWTLNGVATIAKRE